MIFLNIHIQCLKWKLMCAWWPIDKNNVTIKILWRTTWLNLKNVCPFNPSTSTVAIQCNLKYWLCTNHWFPFNHHTSCQLTLLITRLKYIQKFYSYHYISTSHWQFLFSYLYWVNFIFIFLYISLLFYLVYSLIITANQFPLLVFLSYIFRAMSNY